MPSKHMDRRDDAACSARDAGVTFSGLKAPVTAPSAGPSTGVEIRAKKGFTKPGPAPERAHRRTRNITACTQTTCS